MARELSKIINNWVPEESKVIDFGCGDGSLLQKLIQTKNVLGFHDEFETITTLATPKAFKELPLHITRRRLFIVIWKRATQLDFSWTSI